MIVFALFVALFYFSPDNFQEKTAMDQLICGAILLIILVGAIYFWRTYVDPKENRERRAKGYQEQHTYFGGPTYWRPNPDEKDPDKIAEFKSRGYRWSEKYHTWYMPKPNMRKYRKKNQ